MTDAFDVATAAFHKGNLLLGNQPIIDRVVARVRPQVDALVINTNLPHTLFNRLHYPLLSDEKFSDAGPLSGLLTVMAWAQSQNTPFRWIASFPSDTPFLPENVVEALRSQAENTGSDIGYARYGEQTSQLVALWSLSLFGDLQAWLEQGERGVKKFIEQQRNVSVPFDYLPQDPFFNINTPAQLEHAEKLLNINIK